MSKEKKIQSPSVLEKSNKRKVQYIIGGAILVVVIISMSVSRGTGIRFVKEPPKMVDTAPPDLSKQLNAKLQGDLDRTKKQLEDEKAKAESTVQSQQEMLTLLKSLEATARENERKMAVLEKDLAETKKKGVQAPAASVGSAEAKDLGNGVLVPNIPMPPGAKRGDYKAPPMAGGAVPPPTFRRDEKGQLIPDNIPSPTARSGSMAAPRAVPVQPIVMEGDPPVTEAVNADGIPYDERMEENIYAGFLPAGSFADIVLMSGVDAGASEYTRSNPQPIFMRVQSDAVTAGMGRYKMKTCFVGGSAYGELSSERANVSLTRLTCVDRKKKMLLEVPVTGYVVDSDGKQGLRGKVVRRNGAIMAKAILAGFASGAGELLATAGQTQTTTAAGVATTLDPTQLTESGMYKGAGEAANILAEMYIKEAKSIFPIIEIPSGRKGSIVITVGTKLEWHPYEGKYLITKVPNVK